MKKSILVFLEKNFYFTSKEARKAGVTPSQIAYYIKKGNVEKVSRGVYKNLNKENTIPMQWEDLVITVNSVSHGVVCLISALQIYEMTDEFAYEYWIAIPINQWPPKRKNIRVVRMRNMSLGKIKYKLNGNSFWIFDRERTVIDCFRLLSREVALIALKKYLITDKNHKPNFKKLNLYAKKLHFDLSPYIEALTS